MPFLNHLRRLSGFSFDTQASPHDSDVSAHTSKSSPTLESPYDASTPASSIPPSLLNLNLPPPDILESLPQSELQQPPESPESPESRRNSTMLGRFKAFPRSGTKDPVSTPKPPYMPHLGTYRIPEFVHHNLYLVRGEIGDANKHFLKGTLIVSHHLDRFPPIEWPVVDSQFKALIHLSPGRNNINLEFFNPKLTEKASLESRLFKFKLDHVPLNDVPPVHLAVVLASDSPGTFDAVPERIGREGNDVETAVQKYRMAAYLWQAHTADHMYNHGLLMKSFRYEEEWQLGTVTNCDRQNGHMRNEAKVNVVRIDKTMAELRDMSLARQDGTVRTTGSLFDEVADAISRRFQVQPGQNQYVSALFLDTHWDKKSNLLTGYVAQGGTRDGLHLALFGSQSLQSYPRCMEEVVSALTDCTRTDTEFVANYRNESPSNWEAASAGIGEHLQILQEVLGCAPAEQYGRQHWYFNRTFLVHDASSLRAQERSRLITRVDEMQLHRLDALRYKLHPYFKLPFERRNYSEDSPHIWPISKERIVVSAMSGIAYVEIHPHGAQHCQGLMEFWKPNPDGSFKEVCLSENEARKSLTKKYGKIPLRLDIYSNARGKATISDLKQFWPRTVIKINKDLVGFRGGHVGMSFEGRDIEDVVLRSAVDLKALLTSVKVYHEPALIGVEFCYEDSTSQLFGMKSSEGQGTVGTFGFDTRRGEIFAGLYVHTSNVVNGIQILTNQDRRSEFFGDASAPGTRHTLTIPRGYSVRGISGVRGAFVEGLAMIISQ